MPLLGSSGQLIKRERSRGHMFTCIEKVNLLHPGAKPNSIQKRGYQKVCILKKKQEKKDPKFFFWRKSYIFLVLCSSFAYLFNKNFWQKKARKYLSAIYIRVSISLWVYYWWLILVNQIYAFNQLNLVQSSKSQGMAKTLCKRKCYASFAS